MALIRNGEPIADVYSRLAEEDALPETGAVIVDLARWRRERERLIARAAPVGIRLKNDENPAALEGDFERIALIELDFPKFTDGRAFSQARWLREKFGFKGEIRAGGQVLRDQYLFMLRCGIDTAYIPEGKRATGYGEAVKEFSVWYQIAADRRPRAVDLRHGKRAELRLAAAE